MSYAAAVFIPIALIIGLFIRINSQVDLLADDGYDEVYVPNGERMQVLFQDGSKVHLNSGSRIRYPKKFGLSERKVYLEGEAWFEVAKNKNRPFIVDLSYMDIKVLGTTFDVKAIKRNFRSESHSTSRKKDSCERRQAAAAEGKYPHLFPLL